MRPFNNKSSIPYSYLFLFNLFIFSTWLFGLKKHCITHETRQKVYFITSNTLKCHISYYLNRKNQPFYFKQSVTLYHVNEYIRIINKWSKKISDYTGLNTILFLTSLTFTIYVLTTNTVIKDFQFTLIKINNSNRLQIKVKIWFSIISVCHQSNRVFKMNRRLSCILSNS